MTPIERGTTATVTAPPTTPQASLYQQVGARLATLKLHGAAAEHLAVVLDRAQAEGLSVTPALELLFAVEVEATEARRVAGRHYDAAPNLGPKVSAELATGRHLESTTNIQAH